MFAPFLIVCSKCLEMILIVRNIGDVSGQIRALSIELLITYSFLAIVNHVVHRTVESFSLVSSGWRHHHLIHWWQVPALSRDWCSSQWVLYRRASFKNVFLYRRDCKLVSQLDYLLIDRIDFLNWNSDFLLDAFGWILDWLNIGNIGPNLFRRIG
jgi:hypothetical protein